MEDNIMRPNTDAEVYNIVSFRLNQKTYALPLQSVVQIIPMVALLPLPQAHQAIEGIMNFRGNAVPVINMRRYLGFPEATLQLHTPIVLLRIDNRVIGLIVDEVTDIASIPAQKIAPLAEILPDGLGQIPILEGLIQLDSESKLLLNIQHLFSVGQVQALGEVVSSFDLQFDNGNGTDNGKEAVKQLSLVEEPVVG
ncbi:MAG: purine-binding chemotaxis protein CheW [Anaerolineae bacterium]|nr:purine-binding chemotaxis protein CheW [Anaerolineae bacterium]